MPRIDPQQLLVCLTPLLAHNGGIKSPNEVIRLANLMEKYSKKLVSKCIYIQILKCTETELLGQFMAAGGWNLVHNWLRDGSETLNWAFVQELLEMLLLCPVDGNRLKSNHTPKIVKNLSLSCPHVAVKILSSKLVEQWLKIAHQEKQLLTSQPNGMPNGLNGITNHQVATIDSASVVSNVNIVKEIIPNETVNGQVSNSKSEDDLTKKQSKENIKYKVSNKEGGKLLLSLKRSLSPSGHEKTSKVPRTSSQDSKSKSSASSSDKDKDKSKKTRSSSSSHRSSSSSKSSHRDKERSGSTSSSHHKRSSKDKESSKSSSSKHSSSSRGSREKDKDPEKRKKETEKSQAEKDKETLNLLAPLSSNKLQRIPKRLHSDNGENKSAESNKDPSSEPLNKAVKNVENVEKKKPSISIEVRKGEKPKTVKTINSQFRNHGLAEEPPKPPSRKDIKKPATIVVPLIALPSAQKTSISPPPVKKLMVEKVFEPDVPERVGGVKLIKPKPMLVESIGFMDALSASATVVKKDPKKRKRLTSNSKKDEPDSPKREMKPMKFYNDTLEEAEEDQSTDDKASTKDLDATVDLKEIKEESEGKGPESPAASVKQNGNSTEKREKSRSPESDTKEEEVVKRGPGIGCGIDGPPGVLVDLTLPRRKKRPLRWKAEEELTEIRYFELDETERTNVSKTFIEQKAMEHGEERSGFELGRKMQNVNTMAEQTEWRPLIIVDNVPDNVNFGYKSREAEIQAEREKNVLQELYFRHSINDSPHEPDSESYEHTEPQIIPLEDVTGNPDSINNFTDIQWPAPKGELPSTFLSNAFGNVFSNINIPSALRVPPAVAMNSIANPLANLPLGMVREPPNPIIAQWMVPPTFLQPPPGIVPPQGPQGFGNRGGSNNNNFRNNNRSNNNNNSGGGGNWVRGNSRRGICNQFQRNGFCRNKNCPYIHER